MWPLMLGHGTYLYVKDDVQLWTIGSPVVWWLGALGLVIWGFVAIRKKELWFTWWLGLGYAISYLPFGLINRVMWNYHYFVPLLYSLLMGAIAANALAPKAVLLPLIIIGAEIGCWFLYYPITYGSPIPLEALKKRMLRFWTY
jgi:dolichyl-phosphate-mannose-protein mannosyltransferase